MISNKIKSVCDMYTCHSGWYMIVHIHHLYYFLSYFLFRFTSFFFENVPTTLRPLTRQCKHSGAQHHSRHCLAMSNNQKNQSYNIFLILAMDFEKTTNKIYFLSYSLLSEDNTTIGNHTVNYNCKK